MIRVGVAGSGFAAELHCQGVSATGRAEPVAVYSPTESKRNRFAERWGMRPYPSLAQMLDEENIDALTVALPNRFHKDAALAAAARGIAVICEKPLALSLEDADAMILACDEAGVPLMYAEELCFAPQYRRIRDLVERGALGRVVSIQHRERHDGPHADWFFDPETSGGGALMDMACHGIEVARWLMSKEPVVGVFAHTGTFRHTTRKVEDHAVVTLRFDGGSIASLEGSWAVPGGIDERLEVVGTAGSVVGDLARGSSLLVHSSEGHAYGVEKSGGTVGWSHTGYDEAWHWGWFAEFEHFIDCLEGASEPEETGRDGRATLEIVLAAYASAATGREIELPLDPSLVPGVHQRDPGLRWHGDGDA